MGAQPDVVDVQHLGIQMKDSGGEISMGEDETNKLRAALGMAPLKTSKEENSVSAEEKRIMDQREEAARKLKAAEAAHIAARIESAREERELKMKLAKVRTLGDSDEEEGDGAAGWVAKSRAREVRKKQEEKLRAELTARQLAAQDDEAEDSEESEEEQGFSHLKGLKVKHGASELQDGETVVLTLADKGILDERGELDEEGDALENINLQEQKSRDKARHGAKKPTAKYFVTSLEEDKKDILSKYDDAPDEDMMTLDDTGAALDEKQIKQEEIRKKLAAAGKVAQTLTGNASGKVIDEYYTQEEMTSFNKPKKKKKKKLRKKDSSLMEELERSAPGGSADLMSRSERQAQLAANDTSKAAQRSAAFEIALSKARDQSQTLRESEADEYGLEEEDAELYESLARARRAAQQQHHLAMANLASLVDQVASRRTQEVEETAEEDAPADTLVLTDTQEFCRAVLSKKNEEHDQENDADGDTKMDPSDDAGGQHQNSRKKNKDEDDVMDFEREEAEEEPEGQDSKLPEAALGEETKVDRGLASTLKLLQDTGTLHSHKTVSGRTNDKKKGRLQRAWDESGIPTDVQWKFNFKLEREDEWGRRMTPKEAFREFSWKFHGKKPGKMKLEKRMKQAEEEQRMKGMAMGDTPLQSMTRIREATENQKSPYIVLSGSVHAGQTRDSMSGYAVEEKESALSEKVLGDQTPMVGDQKVEFMLGISKAGVGGKGGTGKVEGTLPPPAKRSRK